MRSLTKATLAVLLLALAVLPAQRIWRGAREWQLDGSWGLIRGLVGGEDTAYAEGYSADAFGRISVGMPRASVHRLVGAPLASWTIDTGRQSLDLAESWSRSPGDTHYRMRTVVFRGERVAAVRAGFYID